MFQDSLTEFTKISDNLKRRVQITFFNEQGLEEAGIDGGGVFKEFMDSLAKM
jgi:ubiquitin-protein ligase E3 C